MEKIKNLINERLDEFPEFAYYLPIIDKAVSNKEIQPDISIEVCKALLEGISKTIILSLDQTIKPKDLEKLSMEAIVKKSSNLLRRNDEQFEIDFVNRSGSLAKTLGELRNSRGDISHGKAVPKTNCSNKELAIFTLQMVESILLYKLHSFYYYQDNVNGEIEEELEQEILYSDNQDFNEFLDYENPLDGKVLYSEALFMLYPEDYKVQLEDYLYEREIEEE